MKKLSLWIRKNLPMLNPVLLAIILIAILMVVLAFVTAGSPWPF